MSKDGAPPKGRDNRHEPKDDKIKVKPNLVWQLCRQPDRDGYDRANTHTTCGCVSQLPRTHTHMWARSRIVFPWLQLPATVDVLIESIRQPSVPKKSYKLVGSWIESSCSRSRPCYIPPLPIATVVLARIRAKNLGGLHTCAASLFLSGKLIYPTI